MAQFIVKMNVRSLHNSDTPDMTVHDLEILLRDALGAFWGTRSKAEEYVKKNYSFLDEEQQARKIQEVMKRVEWAHAIDVRKADRIDEDD